MDNRTYKRSWKNLLINKRYQLRFTLFMVGLCTVLMIALGWWVMKVATETTQVAYNQLLADVCKDPKLFADPDKPQDAVTPPEQQMGAPPMTMTPDPAPPPPSEPGSAGSAAPGSAAPPSAGSAAPGSAAAPPSAGSAAAPPSAGSAAPGSAAAPSAGSAAPDSAAPPPSTGTPAPAAGSGSAAAGSGSAAPVEDEDAARRRRRASMTVTSEITMLQPSVSKHFGKQVIEKWTCKYRTTAAKHRLEAGRARILYVLIFVGIVLVLFLAVYGIKMTHKVAGPLFKVGLYHAKMREGRFDKVYNLRKGDQLVNFYEHFKTAHAGVVKAEQAEIKQLKAVIAAAEAAGAGDDPAVVELRELVARKEKALA